MLGKWKKPKGHIIYSDIEGCEGMLDLRSVYNINREVNEISLNGGQTTLECANDEAAKAIVDKWKELHDAE